MYLGIPFIVETAGSMVSTKGEGNDVSHDFERATRGHAVTSRDFGGINIGLVSRIHDG